MKYELNFDILSSQENFHASSKETELETEGTCRL
jgi:hypothetical protein